MLSPNKDSVFLSCVLCLVTTSLNELIEFEKVSICEGNFVKLFSSESSVLCATVISPIIDSILVIILSKSFVDLSILVLVCSNVNKATIIESIINENSAIL